MSKMGDMLIETLPDKTEEERDNILWNCTAYPAAGSEDEGIAMYREQIEECMRESPDNPMKYASDQMDAAWEKGRRERGESNMIVISGNCGNYISFGHKRELENLIENLKDMLEKDSGDPHIYGWASDAISRVDFNREFALMKEMIANDLQARKQKITSPSSSG